MKKTLASFLIATMIMAPANVHASEERIKEIQSQMIELQKELNDLRAEQIGEDIINGTVENGESVLYLSHEVMKDHYGDDCLVVYFNYTNNTEENRTFAFSVYGKGFQCIC